MLDFFSKLFARDFMAHGYCFRWEPDLVWTHAVSDVLTALSYYVIPIGLVYLVRRRRDLAFSWMFYLFGAFILSCGTTHVMAIITLWHPVYRAEGLVKALTAAASLPTALLLVRLIPKVLLIPSPEQLRQANEALQAEILERRLAEDEIVRLNHELETRVQQRTAELHALSSRLRAITDHSPLAIFVLDKHRNVAFWNPAAVNLYGWTEEQILAHPFPASVPAGDPHTAIEHRQADGSVTLLEFASAPLEKGETLYIASNVTERRRMQDSLRVSEHRFRTLAESLPDMIWITDATGHIEYLNSRWYDFTGVSEHESIDAGWNRVMEASDLVFHQAWRNAIDTGEGFAVECRLRAADGSSRWHLARALALRDPDGNIDQWIGVATDIHDRKQSEERLLKMNADLQQFAYAVSHDLQEPLRNLSMYSQLVHRRYGRNLDPEGSNFLEFIQTGALRMKRMLEDISAYTQIGNQSDLPATPVEGSVALQEALDNLQTPINDSQAVITFDPLPKLRLHHTHLVQLFQNLVSNAIKYRGTSPPRIHISAFRTHEWTLLVRDHGIGIAPAYHQRIFGVFKRLHRNEYSGTGIGLAICQRIVEQYGGRIWVESEEGAGATFFFTLPKAEL